MENVLHFKVHIPLILRDFWVESSFLLASLLNMHLKHNIRRLHFSFYLSVGVEWLKLIYNMNLSTTPCIITGRHAQAPRMMTHMTLLLKQSLMNNQYNTPVVKNYYMLVMGSYTYIIGISWRSSIKLILIQYLFTDCPFKRPSCEVVFNLWNNYL